MSRTCWRIDRPWIRSDDTVPKCTCAVESPDFNVKLPAFMDFSPTELPTTGMTTDVTTAAETPTTTPSETLTKNGTALRETTTSSGLPVRTVSTATQHAQEAAENSASTLKGATPHLHLTSKDFSTLGDTKANRNTTHVFLRTAKPTVPIDDEGITSPRSVSFVTENTFRTTTEGLLEVKDLGLDTNNAKLTTRLVEQKKENDSKDRSLNASSRDFAVGPTKRIPLENKPRPSNITSTQSPQTNTLTNAVVTSYPSNSLESVTNTDSTNRITNDAVTSKTPRRINHVPMVTKSSSTVNSRTSSTTVKSRRSTTGRITTPLSSSVLFSSVSSSSSYSSLSSGGIHVPSRSSPASYPHSSASPGLNASHGHGRGGGDSRLMLVATSSSGGACVLLLLFTLLIFLIYRSREKKQSNREIDVIPVTNEEPSLQGTPQPGELKRQLASPVGNNNPTLTESQDRGIDGAANSSSSINGAATNTIVTLTDASLKGDPV